MATDVESMQPVQVEDLDIPTSAVKGQKNLLKYVDKSQCECLNESNAHTLDHALSIPTEHFYLQSDCDEQLIINISFNENVRLHSISIKAPEDSGPKFVRFFQNSTYTLDFDQAESSISSQDFELKAEELDGRPVLLKYVKFQNVKSVQLFVKTNQTDQDQTRIDHIAFYGLPIGSMATDMDDFKRVAGKKGEAH